MRYKILDPSIISKFFLPTISGSPKTFCQKLLETEVNPWDHHCVMLDMKTNLYCQVSEDITINFNVNPSRKKLMDFLSEY